MRILKRSNEFNSDKSPVNMTSDHSVSTNNSFKSHLNAKSFSMCLTL